MREIKFRGRKSNGEWIYGYYNQTYTYEQGYRDCIFNHNVGFVDVTTDTIGQFTGLHDKNGKEIYFGDIVRDKYGDIGSVIWFSDCSIRVDWGGGDIHFIDPDWGLEIIGNIHDNPELLNK